MSHQYLRRIERLEEAREPARRVHVVEVSAALDDAAQDAKAGAILAAKGITPRPKDFVVILKRFAGGGLEVSA